MATILFVVPPVVGSIHASLKLAKDLKAQGHTVSYLGLASGEDYVRSHGLAFTPIFTTWFPKEGEKEGTFLHAWRGAAKIRAFLDALILGTEREFFHLMDRLKPDLMVFLSSDDTMLIPALLAYAGRIRSLYLSDTLGRTENTWSPPIRTGVIPSRSIWTEMKIALAWKQFLFMRVCVVAAYNVLGLGFGWPKRMKQLARVCGYPWDAVKSTDVLFAKLRLPELVLCPRAFDFPSPDEPGRYYIGASLDLTRRHVDFPWDRVDERAQLIYCSLGTMTWLSPQDHRLFFQAVVEAARSKPAWQWVLAVGEGEASEEVSDPPSNVIMVKQAPQLALLQRAWLMIGHGGLNSIKECIYFGVPMVLFPSVFDGPGNTARVMYHGLGVRGDLKKVTAAYVAELIDQIERDASIRLQVKVMQGKFRESEAAGSGVQLIDTMLAVPAGG